MYGKETVIKSTRDRQGEGGQEEAGAQVEAGIGELSQVEQSKEREQGRPWRAVMREDKRREGEKQRERREQETRRRRRERTGHNRRRGERGERRGERGEEERSHSSGCSTMVKRDS
jgi:hypothetical protein